MIVAVIAHVFDDITAEHIGSDGIGHGDVGDVAAGQLTFNYVIGWRDGQMQLAGYAATAYAAAVLPPFAPPP